MSDNDPFGLGGGGGAGAGGGAPKTVVVPNPGGMRPSGGAPSGPFGGGGAPSGMPTGLGAADASAARPGINPLVDAASPLLELVIYLSRQMEPMPLTELRSRVLALMSKFTDEAQRLGQHRQIVEMARYAMSATLDDVIMSRPWGDLTMEWGANSLGSQLESEVYAGDKFFANLEMCLNEPRAKDLLELKYICLSLGFKGRYRNPSEAGKAGQLDQWRSRAFSQLVAWRGGLGEVVADNWEGEAAPRKPMRDMIPLWLVASVSVGLAALVFIAFFSLSGDAGARAVAAVHNMPLQGDTQIVRYDPPAEKPVEIIAPPPPAKEQVEFFLQPEIDEGLVQVYEDNGLLYIRVITEAGGRAMFGPAKAVVQDQHYVGVLQRIAAALNEQQGSIVVQGHTDSVPLRNNRKFPSNYHLSVSRAEAALGVMAPIVSEGSRISAEGLGDTRPLATNKTPEGRARNRRVEIVLVRR
jgi:type VI secretion system protein ImpK